MDTEHWFAPMAGSPDQQGRFQPESYLYISTNETTSFPVEIYNNNALYTTVYVSKGNPQVVDIPINFMMTVSSNDLFTPVAMGLNVKGSNRFFANYRFAVPSHAEIITSKGLAGVGKTFFAAMAPNTTARDFLNSTIGIVATEDNTLVTVSGYDPQIIFSDGSTEATKTFLLNKGQSYIIDARSMAHISNRIGLIGAKIVSDQPIAVTNGNFNGIYTYENTSNNDILMDQAVPVERLGKEFILVKGNGPATNNMESALVIATEDDTQIVINGVDSGVVLKAGMHFLFNSKNYIDQGRDHYNMSISTSKNAYVYQLLAGVSLGNPYATGGFNFIPALSCFLPNKIDEISDINRIGYESFNTKLNIITEKGAVVSVNGTTLSGFQGPFPVRGNANWETYTVLNVSGNITVNSTKSVTAGIAAGNGNVGFGGYFAGFSSVPVISKTGDCYAGVILQVDDSYDKYQWYRNGAIISGETTYSINPDLYGTGSYTVMITKTNCETKLTSEYLFALCPPISTTTITEGSCNLINIIPKFTTSSQTINPAKTKIVVKPLRGTVTFNATGIITYTPNTNLPADISDLFVYYIEGNGNPEDSEFFKVIINIKVLKVENDTIKKCPDLNGKATFNLSQAKISNNTTDTLQYFSDSGLTTEIRDFTAYTAGNSVVYARVTSTFGCAEIAQIKLEIIKQPVLNTRNYNGNLCDEYFDEKITVKFSEISPKIIDNYDNSLVVKYYLSPGDQQSDANNLPDNWTYNSTTTVYIRIENPNGCSVVFGEVIFTVGNKISLFSKNITTSLCDEKIQGNIAVNLSDYTTKFTTDSSVVTTFYASELDANKKRNTITSNQIINKTTIFYFRFENATSCPNVASLTLNIQIPLKSNILKDEKICPNSAVFLDAGTGFDSYKWSTGETTQRIKAAAGTYFVDLASKGCVYRQTVIVTNFELPTITNLDISGTSVTVNVSGGNPPYLFSADNINFQSSNILSNFSRGKNIIYVKDASDCNTVSKEFLILNLINVITPDGDGMNDVLNYSDLSIKRDVTITIFNRYGKQIFSAQKPPYLWDGKINGTALPTGSYWYILSWTEPDTNMPVTHKGWILVKNRN